MLTREQARQSKCRSCVSSITFGYHQNGHGISNKTFYYPNCIANECAKWIDLDGDKSARMPFCGNGTNHGHQEHCDVSASCNDCHHRYGRCGG